MKAYQALGKERTQKIGSAMGDLRKVTASDHHAKYMLIRREKEHDIAYEVLFEDVDREWKMRDF
ncbi:MAG: hypothetical protein HGB21_08785 [Nitrospirae bacterium]|nr:hypothetical protein [Nitrospirota bacterium]